MKKTARAFLFPAFMLMLATGVSGVEKTGAGVEKPALQTPSTGKIDRHYIYSPEMAETITIDVWTPQGYPAADGHRYPVIYMHDGQNLFDAATTWNRQAWEMDSVTSALILAGEIEAPVIVGIHSVAETRLGDLLPQKAVDYITVEPDSSLREFLEFSSIRGDAYAEFMAKTLKHTMDSIYRLSPSCDSTFVMGSSMGGLMSIYAMSEHPGVFGGAACISTHWIGTTDGKFTFTDAMHDYLADKLPRDGRHRLYLDHGTTSVDSLYGPANERMVALV